MNWKSGSERKTELHCPNLESTNWYTAIHLVIRPWVIYMNNWALIKGFLSGFRKDFSAFAVYYSEMCLVCWQSSKTHRSVLWCVGSETYAKTYWNSLCTSSIGILRRSWCHLPSKEEIKHQSDVFKLEKLLFSLQIWLFYLKKAIKMLGLLKVILGEVLTWPLSSCRGQGRADPGYSGLADQRESYEIIICIKGANASQAD